MTDEVDETLKEEVLEVKEWWDIEFNPSENKMNLNEWTEEIKNTGLLLCPRQSTMSPNETLGPRKKSLF